MATFQMETRQQQNQQRQRQQLKSLQRTNLKQRTTTTTTTSLSGSVISSISTAEGSVGVGVGGTTTSRRQRQRQRRQINPPQDQGAAQGAAQATVATRLLIGSDADSGSVSVSGTVLSSSSSSATSTPTTATTTCARLWPTAAAPRLLMNACTATIFDCCSCQRAVIMLTTLVVVIVVISGNGVFAAQRDSYKSKEMSSNNNAIPSSSNSNSNSNSDDATPHGSSGTGSIGSSSSNVNGNNNGISSSSSSSGGNNRNGHAMSMTTSSGMVATTITGILSSSSSSSNSNLLTNPIGNANTIASPSASATASALAGSGAGINRNSIEMTDEGRNGAPYFDRAASKNVTALLGKTAYLNCRVKNLGNRTMLMQVSWVRHRDIHLLTVGRYTYTSDQRFRAIHQPQTEDWMLQIKYPQHRDSGVYECQVSTTPHMSHYIHLNVVEPSTEIIGAPDLYIESGSTINLTCVILNSPEPPAYIFWNHNNAIINYDSPRGGVSVVTNKGDTTTSFLLIKSARPSDSGHYQCNPSNAKSRSVTVHVLNGEFPAAMQHAAPAHHHLSSPSRYLLVYLLVYWFSSVLLAKHYMRPSVGRRVRSGNCGVAVATTKPTPVAAPAPAAVAVTFLGTDTKTVATMMVPVVVMPCDISSTGY